MKYVIRLCHWTLHACPLSYVVLLTKGSSKANKNFISKSRTYDILLLLSYALSELASQLSVFISIIVDWNICLPFLLSYIMYQARIYCMPWKSRKFPLLKDTWSTGLEIAMLSMVCWIAASLALQCFGPRTCDLRTFEKVVLINEVCK